MGPEAGLSQPPIHVLSMGWSGQDGLGKRRSKGNDEWGTGLPRDWTTPRLSGPAPGLPSGTADSCTGQVRLKALRPAGNEAFPRWPLDVRWFEDHLVGIS